MLLITWISHWMCSVGFSRAVLLSGCGWHYRQAIVLFNQGCHFHLCHFSSILSPLGCVIALPFHLKVDLWVVCAYKWHLGVSFTTTDLWLSMAKSLIILMITISPGPKTTNKVMRRLNSRVVPVNYTIKENETGKFRRHKHKRFLKWVPYCDQYAATNGL